MSEKTLGQIAYETYWTALGKEPFPFDHAAVRPAAWEATAHAVAAHVANPDAADYDSAAEIMRLRDEIGKHRTRLAMLLADTPFEFRPGWEAEYDDAAPEDGLVPPAAAAEQ